MAASFTTLAGNFKGYLGPGLATVSGSLAPVYDVWTVSFAADGNSIVWDYLSATLPSNVPFAASTFASFAPDPVAAFQFGGATEKIADLCAQILVQDVLLVLPLGCSAGYYVANDFAADPCLPCPIGSYRLAARLGPPCQAAHSFCFSFLFLLLCFLQLQPRHRTNVHSLSHRHDNLHECCRGRVSMQPMCPGLL